MKPLIDTGAASPAMLAKRATLSGRSTVAPAGEDGNAPMEPTVLPHVSRGMGGPGGFDDRAPSSSPAIGTVIPEHWENVKMIRPLDSPLRPGFLFAEEVTDEETDDEDEFKLSPLAAADLELLIAGDEE